MLRKLLRNYIDAAIKESVDERMKNIDDLIYKRLNHQVLKFETSRLEMLETYGEIGSEKFIDKIVERIKRKQLK